jgi:phage host-nuclease inhibitor protein Gam
VEDEPEAGEAFGPREIAFQRFLKTRKRPIEPAAAIVDLAEAVQRIETVRLLLETFGVKPFERSHFSAS